VMAIKPIKLKYPLIITPFTGASGCFGYGAEYGWADLKGLGGVFSKGITLKPRKGNPANRLHETPAGMLNSIGLENPGIDGFIEKKLPELLSLKVPIFANIAGDTVDDYIELANRLLPVKDKLAGLELDLSCPHVEKGLDVGLNPKQLHETISAIKKETPFYVVAKLTPNITNILDIAEPALDAGADALSLTNTFSAMAIHPMTKKPRLGSVSGGLSGPAIRPIVLRIVHQVYRAFKPVIFASGGICSGWDAAEFLLAGATAFQIGSVLFRDPDSFGRISAEFDKYLEMMKVKEYLELRGAVQV
ncbi:MAG: dihydroorotate dehydrogenase, partial [Methylocella sp.]